MLALRRIIEKQAMCREYRGVEPVGRGPVVVVVDESGSMEGPKINNAKALALACAWIAKHQRRWIALVGYSGGCEGTRIALPPAKWDEGALMDWLAHFYSNGTECDVPVAELAAVYWPEFIAQGLPRGKTDVIIITDAQAVISLAAIKAFNAWRAAEKARVTTLVVHGHCAGDLAEISDQVHFPPMIDVDQEAVGKALEEIG